MKPPEEFSYLRLLGIVHDTCGKHPIPEILWFFYMLSIWDLKAKCFDIVNKLHRSASLIKVKVKVTKNPDIIVCT